MRRPWIVLVLVVGAVIGLVLVATGDEDDTGVDLASVVTEQGLRTSVPSGWQPAEERPFEYSPDGGDGGFDQWTVARGCPPSGCASRSLEEWMAEGPTLPTFEDMRTAEDVDLFSVQETRLDDTIAARARTRQGGTVVVAARFVEGAESYVACSVRIPVGGDDGLADALIEVCRETDPVD